MNHPKLTILYRMIGKKLAVLLVIGATAVASFATLGEGNKNTGRTSTASLLSSKSTRPGSFSLKSGYNYRGSQVFSNNGTTRKYISLNTTTTYQKGNTTYIVPLKRKVALGNVKIELGNQQLRKN